MSQDRMTPDRTPPTMQLPGRRYVSRRDFLKGSGLLVVGFSLAGCVPGNQGAQAQASTPGSATPAPTPAAPPQAVATEVAEQAPVPTAPAQASGASANQAEGAARASADQIDAWLAVSPDNQVTIYSGRVELGTGVQTALAQIAADELDVPLDHITMVMGDTQRTPDEGYTAGSKTIQVGGVAVRQAAAQARLMLVNLASQRFGVPVEQLTTADGMVSQSGSTGRQVSYGDLIGNQQFSQTVDKDVRTKSPDQYRIVGQSIPRFDLPGKLTGRASYVQDLQVPGMVHGRVVRPAGVGARLQSVDETSVQAVPGLIKVVRNGNFLGVVAEQEWQAIQAAQQLKVQWQTQESLPDYANLYNTVRASTTQDKTLLNDGNVDQVLNSNGGQVLQATYQTPYQSHGSIGPSCAVADVQSDRATIWSSTQGVYPLRGAVAQLVGLAPETVRVVHVEGSGCYGHNGFDDAAGDAALLSQAVGRPVRLQWMRQDEQAWDPKGPAMVMDVRGAVDANGAVAAWDYAVWTPTHSTRPGGMAANLLPGQLIEHAPPPADNANVGGDRNAKTNYTFTNNRVVVHWLKDSPLRPSALRSLGGGPNTFANESFMDELAYAAEQDPVQFRLRHLSDPRAQAVVQKAAEAAGWQTRPSPDPGQASAATATATGRGIAFSRYENNEAYTAVVAEVQVDRASGQVRVQRMVVAQDAGLIINPDGITNQLEGNLIQATSRALKEQVTFDRTHVTSVDWASYPILTFPEVPQVDVVLVNQPDQPSYGAGEPSTLPVAPAIANAIFDATGARVRTVPFTPDRVKLGLGTA
jgi:nicotinate dehydrogenase subunit B